MREKQKVEKEIEVPIKCDKCGVEFDSSDYAEEYISVDYVAGYGAKYFEDTDKVSFDLCEKCLFEFVKTLDIEISSNLDRDIKKSKEL